MTTRRSYTELAMLRAIRVAIAMIVSCGFTRVDVGNTLASATHTPDARRRRPVGSTADPIGSLPMRAVPIG